jgi:hypothetical protein
MHQEREYPQHIMGTPLRNPDFAALARAYGYCGVRITQTAQFEPELLAALARREGTLIEVVLDPEVISTRGTLSAIRQAALGNRRSPEGGPCPGASRLCSRHWSDPIAQACRSGPPSRTSTPGPC